MIKIDKIGMITSLVCAVHCSILPFVVIFIPSFFVSFFINEVFEWIILFISILTAFTSLCLGYKVHKSVNLIAFITFGFMLLLCGKLVHHNFENSAPYMYNILVVIGGLIISMSHVINSKLCKKCSKCSNEN